MWHLWNLYVNSQYEISQGLWAIRSLLLLLSSLLEVLMFYSRLQKKAGNILHVAKDNTQKKWVELCNILFVQMACQIRLVGHRLFLDYSPERKIVFLHHHAGVDSRLDKLLLCLLQHHEVSMNEYMEFRTINLADKYNSEVHVHLLRLPIFIKPNRYMYK